MNQDGALAILKTGANVFLTGEPGSGKTYTVNRYVAWLRQHEIEPAITASTGIAATHINGMTIHSWSGIGVRNNLPARDLDRIAKNKQVMRRVENAGTLIIDEVSMLSAQTTGMVERVCQRIRGGDKPFGGLQVVLVGDFFQLPPVSRRDAQMQRTLAISNDNHAEFAFASRIWRSLNFLVCYLSEQYRQEDPEFLNLLMAIRRGSFSELHRILLRKRYSASAEDGIPQLFSHNFDVDRVNTAELMKLTGALRTFDMVHRGPENLVTQLKKGCLSPQSLNLKVGARVMFTRNDSERRFVNGTLATILGFSKESGWPVVKTKLGRIILAEPQEWRLEDGGRVLACLIQVPLRLAWAITVHKSQGMSLDAAHMDLSKAFEYGQGYVALSRVRTLEGLSLGGLNERALEVHPEIRAKDEEFRQQSRVVEEEFRKISTTELSEMQRRFIRTCKGRYSDISRDKKMSRAKNGLTQKERRWQHTLVLVHQGRTLEETARLCSRTVGTILEHLEKLRSLGTLHRADIMHLSFGKEDEMTKVHEAFRALGAERLKPIFNRFGGRVSYETIRIARLLKDVTFKKRTTR